MFITIFLQQSSSFFLQMILLVAFFLQLLTEISSNLPKVCSPKQLRPYDICFFFNIKSCISVLLG